MEKIAWRMNEEEWKDFLNDALVFLAPLALIYFGDIIKDFNSNTFCWSIFVPDQAVQGAMVFYVISQIYNFFLYLKKGK